MRVRVATINALGDSHTRPGGNKAGRGWLQSARRTVLLIAVITRRRYSVVGLQEFQGVQQRVFKSRTSVWGCHAIKDNAVIWLRPLWRKVDSGFVTVPYFNGHPKQMPWVELERRGRRGKRKTIGFLSKHNPANVHGPAEKHRETGWEREAQWATRMVDSGRVTVAFVVGDANDPEYGRFVVKHGGKVSHIPTVPGKDAGLEGIDWISAWGPVDFERGRTIETSRISKMTDHPVSQAVAII
jgi:hypothetical protein